MYVGKRFLNDYGFVNCLKPLTETKYSEFKRKRLFYKWFLCRVHGETKLYPRTPVP